MEDYVQVNMEDKEVPELAIFDPMVEKKENQAIIENQIDDSLDKLAKKTENLSLSDGVESSLASLKRKKKVDISALEEESGDATEDMDMDGHAVGYEGEDTDSRPRGDRNYEYEEFNVLHVIDPEHAGNRRRIVIRPPKVLRDGTKKSVFVNFMGFCKTMHRQPDHVMAFLLAELRTTGSLDGQQRLTVKGSFSPNNFERILRKYVNEYVICNDCRRDYTLLVKENRLFFLRCEKCGSQRSVAPIQSGFVARVGRRTS